MVFVAPSAPMNPVRLTPAAILAIGWGLYRSLRSSLAMAFGGGSGVAEDGALRPVLGLWYEEVGSVLLLQ